MIACLNHAFPGIEDSGSRSTPRFYPFSSWDIVQLAKTTHHQLITNIYHKNEKGKPCEMDLPLLKNDVSDYRWVITSYNYCYPLKNLPYLLAQNAAGQPIPVAFQPLSTKNTVPKIGEIFLGITTIAVKFIQNPLNYK